MGRGMGGAKAEKALLTMSSTSELGAQHPLGPTASQLPHRFGSCIGMWDGLMKSHYDPGSGPGVQVGQLLRSDVAEGDWKNISTQDWPRIAQECVGREEGRDQGQNLDDIRGSGSREGCKVPWRSLLTVHQFRCLRPIQGTPSESPLQSDVAVRLHSHQWAAGGSAVCHPSLAMPFPLLACIQEDGSHPRLVMRPGGCPRGHMERAGVSKWP